MFKKIGIVLTFTILFIFLANRLFFFKPGFLERCAANITYPAVWLAGTSTRSIKSFFAQRESYQELLAQKIALEREKEKLCQENIKFKALAHYAYYSKELREFCKRYDLKNAILAKVLVKTLSQEEHSIIVNRGSRHGVEHNMAAIYQYQLIGRVTEVFAYHSKIQLITDSQSKVSAYTARSDAAGVLQGSNTPNNCSLNYVSHLAKIHDNDLVFSSGQGLVFPQGFCLGKITHTQTNGVCHCIQVTPLVDLKTLDMCVLTNQSKMNLF